MKKFRKFTAMVTAIALAGCMMTSMSMLNVSAEDNPTPVTTGSITISNTAENHIYEAYQIFDGDLDSNGILSNITWGAGIGDNKADLVGALKTLTVNSNTPFASVPDYNATNDTSASEVAKILSNITADNDAVTVAFAKVIGNYLSNIATGKSTYSSGTYTISGVDAGYYLVKDQSNASLDAYTSYIVEVLETKTNINPKSDVPKVIKKVQENAKDVTGDVDSNLSDSINVNKNGESGYNDVADYNIGDSVPFRLYGSLPDNLADYSHYYYAFHDTLDTQFTAPSANNVTVTICTVNESGNLTQANGVTLTKGTDYTVTVSGQNIDVVFLDIIGKNITKDMIITVDYSAVLNDTAIIGNPGQENKVRLVYSNNPNSTYDGKNAPSSDTDNDNDNYTDDENNDTGETPDDQVVVFTYELDTTKVDGVDNNKKLANAEFVLYRNSSTPEYVKVNENGIVTGWTTDKEQASTLTSDENGLFKVIGLDSAEYYLEETKAPTGYNILSAPVTVVLNADTNNVQTGYTIADGTNNALKSLSVTADNKAGTAEVSTGIATITVANNKGSSLPSTGGIGTTIFYTVGGVLVVGAGVTLIAKKRAKNEQ